ncbi:MAG: ribosome silencing factor [Actinomycetota bacterium]|nr:ribosome silencing factor [Actinomycetota bacterium]
MNDTEVLESVTHHHSESDPRWLAILAARAASEKKATDPKVLELGELIGVTDYFLICSASSSRQVRTIVDEIEKSVKGTLGLRPRGVEGLSDASWVLIDYGGVVIHVMSEEARAFYALEKLWSDAQLISWDEVA